ncbi:MAG: hypothetical protein AB2L24_23115 [Mangrovibacterium sp.]
MRKINLLLFFLTLAGIGCFTSCQKDEEPIPSTSTEVTYPDPDLGAVKGFFLLNEGNMGSNKATLGLFRL